MTLVDPCVARLLTIQASIISDFAYVLNIGPDVRDIQVDDGTAVHITEDTSTTVTCPEIELKLT